MSQKIYAITFFYVPTDTFSGRANVQGKILGSQVYMILFRKAQKTWALTRMKPAQNSSHGSAWR